MMKKKSIQCVCWSLCALFLLTGCAKHMDLAPWHKPPMKVSFIVKLVEKKELPLQGGMEIGSEGGRMALITQHGRTLGQCQWKNDSGVEKQHVATASELSPMQLVCTASDGLGNMVQSLVRRVAIANYRILHAEAHPESERAVAPYTLKKQQDVYFYSDNSGNMEINFIKREK